MFIYLKQKVREITPATHQPTGHETQIPVEARAVFERIIARTTRRTRQL